MTRQSPRSSIAAGSALLPLLQTLGLTALAGGVIGSARGGLLVVGAPGSGRSTTVLAARRLGLAPIADEFVAVAPDGLVAFPVTGFATVTPQTLTVLPELVARLAQLEPMADGKQATLLDARPPSGSDGMPLRAIVRPMLGDDDGPAAALDGPAAQRVAELAMLPATSGLALTAATALRTLPAFELPVGRDPDAVARALAQLLRDLG